MGWRVVMGWSAVERNVVGLGTSVVGHTAAGKARSVVGIPVVTRKLLCI